MKTTTLSSFILTMLFFATSTVFAQADYQELEGVVVMEAEGFNIDGTGWVVENLPEFDGDFEDSGYLRSPAISFGAINSSTTITVKIKINNPGKYIFKARSRTGSGINSTEHNDMWLKFSDADDFYGENLNDNIVWPAGSGKTPNPSDGPGVSGFFKMYTADAVNSWGWFSRTCGGCSYPIFVDFDSPGIYTMLLSSRSNDYLLDRIVLSNKAEDLDETTAERFGPPSDGTTPESSYTLATSTFDLSKSGISIYPNPSNGILNIKGIQKATASIEIIDTYGRVLPTIMRQNNGEVLQLETSSLAKGLYFVRIGDLGQSAFMVN